MEAEAIGVTVEPELAEYRRILRERSKVQVRNYRIALGTVFTALAIWLFNTLFVPEFDGSVHRMIFLGLCLLFGLQAIGYAAWIYEINQRAKRWTGEKASIRYEFTPVGIRSSTEMVTWESPWRRFVKIVETESDLLFILANNDFVPIPKRFFTDSSVLADLRLLISRNATGEIDLKV